VSWCESALFSQQRAADRPLCYLFEKQQLSVRDGFLAGLLEAYRYIGFRVFNSKANPWLTPSV
jgi:hypothetical protein